MYETNNKFGQKGDYMDNYTKQFKLKELYVFELICIPSLKKRIFLGTMITCKPIVKLKDNKIFERYNRIKTLMIALINNIHIKITDPEGIIRLETRCETNEICRFIVDKQGEWNIEVSFRSFNHVIKNIRATFPVEYMSNLIDNKIFYN